MVHKRYKNDAANELLRKETNIHFINPSTRKIDLKMFTRAGCTRIVIIGEIVVIVCRDKFVYDLINYVLSWYILLLRGRAHVSAFVAAHVDAICLCWRAENKKLKEQMRNDVIKIVAIAI